jgi:hypothetical protein
MSSTYSGGVGKLQLMADGEQSGVWGQITNANLQTLEEMVSGYVTHDVAGSATTTLSGDGNVGSSYSATESKAAIIKLIGAVTGAHDIVAPAKEGWFILWDASTGAYDLTFKPSGGTGVVVPSGGITLMFTDGSTMYTGPTDGVTSTVQTQLDTKAGTATVQTFTAGQRGEITTLTSATTVTPDFADSNNYTLTLGHNVTMANPTNLTAGQSGSIFAVQDGTGSRTMAFGTYWDFAGGTAPTMTTTAAAVDRIDYVVRSTTSIHAVVTLALS